ncbi:MAG: PilZ domain-containing protein [Terriglobales bacterium]
MTRMRDSDELRSAMRFPIKLPVEVRAEEAARLHAETKDISAGGVLFYMDTDMAVGSRIEFNISLPADVLGTVSDVTVLCVGRVVRCSEEGSRRAVAAVIDEYRFERV